MEEIQKRQSAPLKQSRLSPFIPKALLSLPIAFTSSLRGCAPPERHPQRREGRRDEVGRSRMLCSQLPLAFPTTTPLLLTQQRVRMLITQGPLRNPLQPPGMSTLPSARSGSGLYPSHHIPAQHKAPCCSPCPARVTAVAICSEMHRPSENSSNAFCPQDHSRFADSLWLEPSSTPVPHKAAIRPRPRVGMLPQRSREGREVSA